MHRLTLIRHASTSAVRAAAFPLDEALDEAGRTAAGAAVLPLPRGAQHRRGPSRRDGETAELLGLRATSDPALAELDFGRWSGETLAAIQEREPDAVQAWLTDPAASPHGGESIAALNARVAAWLAELSTQPGATVAVTAGSVVQAAIAHALGAPHEAIWRIDITPLHRTVLHARGSHWTLRATNLPPTSTASLDDD